VSGKTIRIALLGTPSDYRFGLVPFIIRSLGYRIKWSTAISADLLIYGSFYDIDAPRLRWLPGSWRQTVSLFVDSIEKQLTYRKISPITLFHTSENLRHDHIKADYAISHDLNVSSEKHLRLPYWMEMIDWSHEGVVGNLNPRYGQLLNLKRLQAPLGNQFLQRAQRAVLMTSHLREPRARCLEVLHTLMPVDGMGSYFDKSIKDHHSSKFLKINILQNYAFNLCPENAAYPGYVTEKIPEAFAAGCLPITFVDESVGVDFNPRAFINLASMVKNGFQGLGEALKDKELQNYAGQPLILNTPSILGLTKFIENIVRNAL